MPLLRAVLEPEPPAAAALANMPVVAFSGTARPERFFDTLRALGCAFPCPPCALPDHAPLPPALLDELRKRAARHHALLVTTSKDAARLPPDEREGIAVLPVSLRWLGDSGRAIDDLLDEAHRRHLGGRAD